MRYGCVVSCHGCIRIQLWTLERILLLLCWRRGWTPTRDTIHDAKMAKTELCKRPRGKKLKCYYCAGGYTCVILLSMLLSNQIGISVQMHSLLRKYCFETHIK